MRVLMASKILVVAAYRRKLEEIAAQPGLDLIAVAPPAWREPGGRLIRFEPGPTPGYQLRVEPIRFNGMFHLFYWPTLGVVLEVQSHRFHLTKAALERDTRKAAQLTAAGLIVSYVTWLQMEHEPYATVARVAQLLARAGAAPR